MMKADFGKIEKIRRIDDLEKYEKMELNSFFDFPDLINTEYSGYLIECEKITYGRNYLSKIGILIEEHQQCCERYGMVISEDDIKIFIGAELIEAKEITAGDINLIPEKHRKDEDTRSVFFNLETDRGLLQFVAYNCHNGFYGHDCHFVISYHNERTESIKAVL